jgi:integrase/recombinase XerD
VAKLKRGSFYQGGDQWMLRFEEKNGKSREIPVRHDLERTLAGYLSALGKTQTLTPRAIPVDDICRMMKRRLKDAGLSPRLSPH